MKIVHVCPRTLDKPVLLFGLELEEVALIAVVIGIGSLTVGPLFPGIMGSIAWVVLIQFKKDKPEGYLLHRLYSLGLSLPGLIHCTNKVRKYGI